MKALSGQLRVELMLFLRDKAVVTFSLFVPVLTVLFFGYLNRGGQAGGVAYGSFLIAGGIGMVVSSAAFENLGVALAQQRDLGLLKRLGGTPLRMWSLLGAKVLTASVIILVQAVIMVALNVLLFKASLTGSLLLSVVTMMMGVLSFTTMGIALASLSRNSDMASAAARAISFPMQFLCGTLFPLSTMPPLLRDIANALPLTYFVDALRGAMLNEGGALEYTKDWLILLGCFVVAFVIAAKNFDWSER
jgi:ABC-2 type transport system permease protein